MLSTILLAAAQGPVDCPDGTHWDREFQTCVITVVDPPGPGDPPVDPPPPTDPPPKDDPVDPPKCTFEGHEIPCSLPKYGWWVDGWNCYVKESDPQPPKSDPVWDGNRKGAIYDCRIPNSEENPGEIPEIPEINIPRWAPEPPPRADGKDPAGLAQRAVAVMRLEGVDIGSTPPAEEGRIGVIGFPTWLWAKDPSNNQVGPITKTVTAGDQKVTATAEFDYIEWDMGNGDLVTCDTPGTPWDGETAEESPDCGYTYEEDGEYQLTATTYWTISWHGMGQSGEFPMTTASKATLTMGEAQVLTQ